MARKLVLCRVLLSDAPVLIFDEPTTGLDPGAAVEFRKVLREVLVKEKGKTVMLASHNLFEVEQICDRVALLHKGKMIASGTPAEVKSAVSDRLTLLIVLERTQSDSSLDLEAILRQIGGVVSLKVNEDGTNGYLTIRIEGSPDFDYSGLFGLLIGRRLRVRSFESSHPSLEEAFLRLTSEVSC